MSYTLDAPYPIELDKPVFGGRRERYRLDSDGEIRTFSTDYSGKIHLVASTDTHQVWHKRAGQCFSGRGRQVYVRPWYALVQVHIDAENRTWAEELEGREVDAKTSRACKKHLLERLAETGDVRLAGRR